MQDAQLYRKCNQLQYTEAKRFLDRCGLEGKLEFKGQENILDVGCGPGDVTVDLLLPLLPCDATLVGVDVSQDMVDYAENNFSRDRVKFRRFNIEDEEMTKNLLTPQGRFQKIFSFHCLQWVNQHKIAFQNLNKLTVAGGSLYLIFIASSKMNDLNDKLFQSPKWHPYLKVLEEFSPKLKVDGDVEKYFETLLNESEFKVDECRLSKSQHTFSSIKQLSDLVTALHPAVREMSPKTLENFVSDIQDIVLSEKLAQHDLTTGQVTAQHQILTIVATKQH